MSFFNFGKKRQDKQPEPTKNSRSSKWNDPEYLKKLNTALENNPGKSAVKIICDTDREVAEKKATTKPGVTGSDHKHRRKPRYLTVQSQNHDTAGRTRTVRNNQPFFVSTSLQ